ncbi:hypothetical protein Ruko_04790 [Ruthenibacterium sp. TH_2024_36131]
MAPPPSMSKRPNRKPGSVLNDDLSRLYVAAQLKPPPRTRRETYRPHTGVAPGRVYRAAQVTKRAGALLPHLSTLTGLKRQAVYFCCTIPGVTPGCR